LTWNILLVYAEAIILEELRPDWFLHHTSSQFRHTVSDASRFEESVMSPPLQGLPLDIKALSGILGSVSIACWVVVFSPQIVENFRRGSAEGLSVVFILIWLVGDVFNVLGAVLQGVLPTMVSSRHKEVSKVNSRYSFQKVILAVYYTIADLVLLLQCFYYEGFTLKDKVIKSVDTPPSQPNERTALLNSPAQANRPVSAADQDRRGSFSSFRERLLSVDATHLSPVTPLNTLEEGSPAPPPPTPSQGVLFNILSVLMVCAAGVLGYWLGNRRSFGSIPSAPEEEEPLHFNVLGQIFGYICAVLYLISRVPQLLLNYRRKSTEGISMLFFLFACIGNVTYALSIIAYEPVCKRPKHCEPGETLGLYGKYFLVNFSWFLGSIGSLFLDLGVFVQYFMYKKGDESEYSSGEEEVESGTAVEGTVVSRSPNQRRDVAYEDAQ
jgi:solute carrier family 66 (lysosomal lysine-arginine transporter), member 1